jgi:hypothetical protein
MSRDNSTTSSPISPISFSHIEILATDESFQLATIQDCLQILLDFRNSRTRPRNLELDQFLAQLGLRFTHLVLHLPIPSSTLLQIQRLNREFGRELHIFRTTSPSRMTW